MKYIKQIWDGYRKKCVPPNASEVQTKETEQAFYAGAAALFTFLMTRLDKSGDEPTPEDFEKINDIGAELEEFGQAFDKRYTSTETRGH